MNLFASVISLIIIILAMLNIIGKTHRKAILLRSNKFCVIMLDRYISMKDLVSMEIHLRFLNYKCNNFD